MYVDTYELKKNWGMNPEFVRRALKKRKEKAAAAKLISVGRAPDPAIVERIAKKPVKKLRKEVADAIEAERRRAVEMGVKLTAFRRIVLRACATFDVRECELKSDRRQQHVTFARQFIYYWSCRRTALSLPQIGKFMGGKDHTTVLHGRDAYVEKRAKMGRCLRRVR